MKHLHAVSYIPSLWIFRLIAEQMVVVGFHIGECPRAVSRLHFILNPCIVECTSRICGSGREKLGASKASHRESLCYPP